MFLTRGDLWLSWEHGLKFFLNYMIDADWAVCAGNWMWVSSSAFEKALNTGFRLDPSKYGKEIEREVRCWLSSHFQVAELIQTETT